jgi:hypothetical protein
MRRLRAALVLAGVAAALATMLALTILAIAVARGESFGRSESLTIVAFYALAGGTFGLLLSALLGLLARSSSIDRLSAWRVTLLGAAGGVGVLLVIAWPLGVSLAVIAANPLGVSILAGVGSVAALLITGTARRGRLSATAPPLLDDPDRS